MALPRTYDSIFSRYGRGLPVNYLRALAKGESDMNPNETTGGAWGLLQVVESVRNGYNRRHGTSHSRQDLLNPKTNVSIATDTMNRIIASYNKTGVAALRKNWHSPAWVMLFTKGWNNGYSNVAGVGFVSKWLKARGIPVTHDNVFKYAQQAGSAKWLWAPAPHAWQKKVTQRFYDEGGPGADFFSGLLKVGLVVGLAYGAYTLMEN